MLYRFEVSQRLWRFESHELRLCAVDILGQSGGARFSGDLRVMSRS